MKSLTQFLNESLVNETRKMEWPNSVLLNIIDIDPTKSEVKLKEILRNGFEDSLTRYRVLFVDSIEKETEKTKNRLASDKAKYLEKMEKDIRKYMLTKPGIMRRSPEKQQKYVDDKLEKLALEFDENNKWLLKIANAKIDDNRIEYHYYREIYTNHGARVFRSIDDLVNSVIEDLKKDDWKKHIKSIMVSSNKFAREYSFGFDVAPIFDDEFEDKLDASIAKFNDFLNREYSSGRYMGD